MKKMVAVGLMILFQLQGLTQTDTIIVDKKVITLSEVIIRRNIDVPSFIERIKNDTTFYKAFKNLRILQFTSLNDIQMFDKKQNAKASLSSRTTQWAAKGCRYTHVEEETTTGDIYDKKGGYNYYTLELYASLFFARDTVCGENNVVGDAALSTKGKTGMQKHKEQLKMLFFNPGKPISGLPFIGNKTAIFEEDMADRYLYALDMAERSGELCYVFSVQAKDKETGGNKNKVVIDEMVTWFSMKNFEVLARNYSLSYKAGVYDFDVAMEVEMMHFEDYLVPKTLRYNGNWDVVLKKRERGVFAATLFNFNH